MKIGIFGQFYHSDADMYIQLILDALWHKDVEVVIEEQFLQIIDRNQKHVNAIVKALKKADALYLATDPDREGEAISWHLVELLQQKRALKKGTPVERVTFNAVTKPAVLEALKAELDPRGRMNPGALRGLALLLVLVVIYGFIGTVRATIIPAVTIPISIPASTRRRRVFSSTMQRGAGEATTRRQPRPASSRTSQPSSSAWPRRKRRCRTSYIAPKSSPPRAALIRKLLGLGFPGCPRGVTVPISMKEKPKL